MYWRFVVLCICFAVWADCWYIYHSLSLGSLHWTCTHVCILYCLFIYALILFLFFLFKCIFTFYLHVLYIFILSSSRFTSMNCLPFRSIWINPLVFVGFLLRRKLCSVCRSSCVIFVLFPFVIVLSVHLRFIPSDSLLVSSNFSLYWLPSCKNPRFNLRDQTGILLQHIVSLLQAKLFLILWSSDLLRRTLL